MAGANGERSVVLSDRERVLLYGAVDNSKMILKRRINGEPNEAIKALLRKDLVELEAVQPKLV